MPDDKPAIRTGAMDLDALKALAHPLRVKIVDTLSTYGSFTASGLAERLGESSGATSYHLRQLEKHNFVREVEGKGTARERWWERVPGAISIEGREFRESPAARAASDLVLNEWTNSRERTLREFLQQDDELIGSDWVDAATISLANIVVTAEQLAEISKSLMKIIDDTTDKYRGQRVVGARSVQLQLAAFPVVDGLQITAEDAS
ncbi:helix-turn-helix domain-containing protein [soil metagenome]